MTKDCPRLGDVQTTSSKDNPPPNLRYSQTLFLLSNT